jgi:tetratricopeptide (TPR) repeat protein
LSRKIVLKRSGWVTRIILVLSLLVFLGFSVVPFLGTFLRGASTPVASPSGTGTPTPALNEDLAARIRGYEAVLQREPDNQTALKGLINARVESGNLAGAVEPLTKLAQLNPEETQYSRLLAEAKEQLGDAEGAAEVYRSVLNQKPGDLQTLDGLAKLLVRQQRPEAAIGLLQDTLKLAPQANQIKPGTVDTPSVQLILSNVYATQSRFEEAIATADEVIKANPTDFRGFYAKGLILVTQGDRTGAETWLKKAEPLAPPQFKDQIKTQLARLNSPTPTPSPLASPSSSSEAPATPPSSPTPTAP